MHHYRLILIVDGQELATDIYFKREETGAVWLRHHYLLLGQMVWLLKRTRDFETVIRRVS